MRVAAAFPTCMVVGIFAFGFVMYLFVSPTVAQNSGYTSQTPGEPPTYINPQ